MRAITMKLLGPAVVVAAFAAAPPAARAQNRYVGSEQCFDCHKDEYRHFAATPKGKLFLEQPRTEDQKRGCEGCHGPGEAHVQSGGEDMTGIIRFGKAGGLTAAAQNAICLRCHDRTARLFWEGSAHEARGVACTSCHTVMSSVSDRAQLKKSTVAETCGQCHKDRTAQLLRFTHMPLREGQMDCTSCHNPHGSPNEKLLRAASVDEVCTSCHAEKRGPFLWEHAPVVESCSNCHDAHGSNHEKMLKISKPRLCQQCHIETRHPTGPQSATATRFVMGRQCTNCHFNLHGSNHPSGFAFTR